MAVISSSSEEVVLARGELRVELALRPFAITVRRAGRRLIRAGGIWVAEGTIEDKFVQWTEGVVAHEDLSPPERALRALPAASDDDEVVLELRLEGGRVAMLRAQIEAEDWVAITLEAGGGPPPLADDWGPGSGGR